MRKVILFQVLLALTQGAIVAQPSVPYTTSSVQGSTIITNYYDPNAGPNVGPGLPISPLDARLNAPLLRISDPTSITSQGNALFQSVPTVQGVAPVVPATAPPFPSVSSYASSFPQQTNYINPYTPTVSANALTGIPLPQNSSNFPMPVPQGRFSAIQHDALVPITTPKREFYGTPFEPTYLFPGLVRFSIDKWVGSDYLYSLSPNIGVVVELVNPNNIPHNIDIDLIKQNIETIFSYSGINPVAESIGGGPPLPFFHLLIFASPVENSYVFSISGRLFEDVRLARLNVKLPGTWQAITWEKQELVVASKALFFEQLWATSKQIAESFTQRVNFFRRQLIEQEDQLKLKCGPRVVNRPFAPQKITEVEAEAYNSHSNRCNSR